MREYRVRHVCDWWVQITSTRVFPGCRRRGRFFTFDKYWLCRQHFDIAMDNPERAVDLMVQLDTWRAGEL
jgi:hypothetical protein